MELNVDIEKKLPGFTLNVNFKGSTDVLGLLGASGAGKSMTLRCIAGLEKPDKGRIVLNGRILFDSEQGINLPSRHRKIGFLFQSYALFPNMTVEDNIGLALEKIPREQRKAIIRKMIVMNKLEGLEGRYPFQLSGGQQQRVALARALAVEPEALLLDEPLSALDEHLRSYIIKELSDSLSDYNGVTVFVTHNIEEAYRVSHKLVVLADGKVEAEGTKEELFMKPPTLASAQLTGYKNLSSANFISPHELNAVDWGVRLRVREEIGKEVHHVGIRAHCIKLASGTDTENVFHCWPVFTSEAPFRTTVYLSLTKTTLNQSYHLQWEISQERWLKLKDRQLPWFIYLNPEKLITILK